MGRKLIINAAITIPLTDDEVKTLSRDIHNGFVSHIIRVIDGHEYEYRVGLVNIDRYETPCYRIISGNASEGSPCTIYSDTKNFISFGYSTTIKAHLTSFVEYIEDYSVEKETTSIPLLSKPLGSLWEYLHNKTKEDIEKSITQGSIDCLNTGHGDYKIVIASPITETIPFYTKNIEEEHINCVAVSDVKKGTLYCIEANMAYDFIHSPNTVRPVRMKYIGDVVVEKYLPHQFVTVDPGTIVFSKNRTIKHLITSVDCDGINVSDLGHMTYKVALYKLTDANGNPFGVMVNNV